MKRFLIALVVVLALGGAAAYFLVVHLKDVRNQAAQTFYKPDVKVTVIEGKRREEIAAQLAAAGICDYNEFMAASQDLEGSLFPDTYRFFPDTPAHDVVQEMNSDYQQRVQGLNVTRDQLILASIVEREAINDTDRPIIAGIYENRLKAGMYLGSDPTVQYAKDSLNYAASSTPQSFKFWTPIVQADYSGVDSLFNTYTHLGLPPAPIANPSLKSIEAAQSPAATPAYYFLYKDKQLLTSVTLQQHNAQAAQ